MSQRFTVSIKSLAELKSAWNRSAVVLVDYDDEFDPSDILDDEAERLYDEEQERRHMAWCFSPEADRYYAALDRLRKEKRRAILERFSRFFTIPGFSALKPSHTLLPF